MRDQTARDLHQLATLMVLVAATSAGCVPRKPLGSQCDFTSTCDRPLVCAAQVCREECRSDRDCTAGWVCTPLGADPRALQPRRDAAGQVVQPRVEVAPLYHAICAPPGPALICRADYDCRSGEQCRGNMCERACTVANVISTCGLGHECRGDRCYLK